MKAEIASEMVVEHDFRCFCGASIVSTEKTLTCTHCGAILGIRRVRRQHWKIVPPQRPHRRLQVRDLKQLAIRIAVYLLLGCYVACCLDASIQP